jgi:outer membrane murein-binding lipoprotein Lpp
LARLTDSMKPKDQSLKEARATMFVLGVVVASGLLFGLHCQAGLQNKDLQIAKLKNEVVDLKAQVDSLTKQLTVGTPRHGTRSSSK